jgi:hypothetical protein
MSDRAPLVIGTDFIVKATRAEGGVGTNLWMAGAGLEPVAETFDDVAPRLLALSFMPSPAPITDKNTGEIGLVMSPRPAED